MIYVTSKGAGILKIAVSALRLIFSAKSVLKKENFEIKKARTARGLSVKTKS